MNIHPVISAGYVDYEDTAKTFTLIASARAREHEPRDVYNNGKRDNCGDKFSRQNLGAEFIVLLHVN